MIYHQISQYVEHVDLLSEMIANLMGDRFLGIETNPDGQFALLASDATLFERDAIDALGVPVKKVVKINSFLRNPQSKYDVPVDADYVTGLKIKLHRKSIIVKGEIQSEEFYESCVNNIFSNLIVKEDTIFFRDGLGFPVYKDVAVTWYCEDESPHPTTKAWRSYYNQLEQIKEGKIRRGNLVANLQMPCIGLISIALNGTPSPTPEVILEGRRFLADYSKEFTLFIEDSNKDIVSCFNDINHPRYILSSDYSWIDSMTPYGITIRQFMIEELTI